MQSNDGINDSTGAVEKKKNSINFSKAITEFD